MSSTLPQQRVLCIDRDSVSLSIRAAVLRSGGFHATEGTSVEDGERLTREQHFDAVVLDENVCLNGNGDLKRISQAFPSFPILILRSRNPYGSNRTDNSRVRTFAKGDGPRAFLAAVRECLEGSGQSGLANAE